MSSRKLSLREVASSAFFRFLVSLSTVVSSFATSLLIARYLGPEAFGTYSLLIWIASILTMLASFGMGTTLRKYVAEFEGRQDNTTVSTILGFVLLLVSILSTAVGLLAVLFAPEITGFFSLGSVVHIPLVVVVGLSSVSLNLFREALAGLRRFDYLALSTFLTSAVILLLSVPVLLCGRGVGYLLAMLLLGNLLGAIVTWRLLFRAGVPITFLPLPRGVKSRLLRYAFSIAIITLIDTVVWQRSEVFFLGRFHEPEQAGFYNLAYGLVSMVMLLIPGSLSGVLMPFMSMMHGGANDLDVDRIFVVGTRYLAVVTLPVCFGGVSLARLLVQTLYGTQYLSAVPVLQIVFIGGTIGAISSVASSVVYATDKQAFIVKYGLFLATVNLLLALLLIPKLGAVGAALSNSLTQLGAIGGIYYVCRTRGIAYPFKPVAKVALISLFMGVCLYPLGQTMQTLLGLISAVAAGAVICSVGFVSTRVFSPEEIRVFRDLARKQYASVKGICLRVVSSLARN